MNIEKNKSSLNINENLVSIIPYLGIILAYFEVTRWFCWIVPMIIFFIEKKSVLVKKHSVIALIVYIIQLILFGIIYLLFSSNEVCAWGSCQEIPRYLTANGNNMKAKRRDAPPNIFWIPYYLPILSSYCKTDRTFWPK